MAKHQSRGASNGHNPLRHVDPQADNIGASAHIKNQVVLIFIQANANFIFAGEVNSGVPQGMQLVENVQSNPDIQVQGMDQIDEAYADTVACWEKESLVAESNNSSYRLGDNLIEADQVFCLSFNTSSLENSTTSK